MRKGSVVSPQDVERLCLPEPASCVWRSPRSDDVGEDEGATRIGRAVGGDDIVCGRRISAR